jgi:N-acetylmuramoyl-L-alanine amidase
MKPLICLQAGHENAKNNCVQALRGGTGAPGEAEFTVRIRNRLSQILQEKGFAVQLVDATFNCNPERGKDFSLFLAIHYDADIYGTGGGFVDIPEPSTDLATKESKRIRDAIAGEYFKHSGIKEINRSNANTRYYYMWKELSAKTPCVIIECGVGKDEHDSVILADTDRVANAIARGICKAFNMPFDTPAPTPPTPPPAPSDPHQPCQAEIKRLNAETNILRDRIKELEAQEPERHQSLVPQLKDLVNKF